MDSGHFTNEERITELAKIIVGIPQVQDGEQRMNSSIRKPGYKKTLAALILTEKYSSIQRFIECRVDDSKLPLNSKTTTKERLELCLRGSDFPLSCFQGWNSSDSLRFYKTQWLFVAPFFRQNPKGPVHYVLPKQAPLPFKAINKEIEANTYKNLMKGIEIRQDHTNIPSYLSQSGRLQFALQKTDLWSTKVDFYREVAVLRRVSAYRTDHLIRLLFTLELQDSQQQGTQPSESELFFVFPLPSGNLEGLWNNDLATERVKGNAETANFALWVATQCRGITEAVGMIHNAQPGELDDNPEQSRAQEFQDEWSGIHANIVPRTIFWFQNSHRATHPMGLIQLGGFGQTTFYHQPSRVRVTLKKGHTRTYSPPEIELGQIISRTYDIWSLGCVFLEFISWIILGIPKKVPFSGLDGFEMEEFSNARKKHSKSLFEMSQDTFYRLVPGEERTTADINPAVIERVQALHSHKDCTQFLHDFLDLVLYEMLVVEDRPLASDISSSEGQHASVQNIPPTAKDKGKTSETVVAQKRLTSLEVVSRLDELIKRGLNDPKNLFFTEGRPKKNWFQKYTKVLQLSAVTVEQPLELLQQNSRSPWIGG
ncbi:hypothetical protein QBC38DRAFT_370555 [Podospora fimiseda]|uniref:Protein kinase domain-containing protein n=1 Tax=Podospora fimiseda TaxID=252190 RepID=A0AAN7BJZ1_9PEZI|nr:hypothetical protein QBC38DRAFT_370555 [Podospora fimiseda]